MAKELMVAPYSPDGIIRIFRGGKQSVADQTVHTLISNPLKGTSMSIIALISKGKWFNSKELYENLHKRKEPKDESSLEELVTSIDSGDSKLCENILGHRKFTRWLELKKASEAKMGSLTNYVVRQKNGELSFVAGKGEEGLSREQAIAQRVKLELDIKEGEVIRMSPGANLIGCIRHEEYSRNGKMFQDLEDRGGESVGEIQECLRQLVRIGCLWDEKTQSLQVDSEIEERVIQARLLGKYGLRTPTREEIEREKRSLRVYLTQVGKYAEIKKLLAIREKPVVDEFLASSDYLKLEKGFRDCHLSAHGLTERRVAEEIIANWMLPDDFQTCWKIDGWKETRDGFRADNGDLVTRIEQIIAVGMDNPCQELKNDLPEKKALLDKADDSLVRLRDEIQRIEDGKPIWNWINWWLGKPFLDNDKGSVKPWTQIISWMVFTGFKVTEGGKVSKNYTTALWFPEGDYYPRLEPIKTAEGEAMPGISESLKFIFNGEGDARDQESRIRREECVILEYVKGVPGKVGELARGFDDPWLAEQILGEMNSTEAYDPSGVNLKFLGDFEGFRRHLKKKMVRDYVSGFRNEVWQLNDGVKGQVKAAVSGEWENTDFTKLDDEIARKARINILCKGNFRTENMAGEGSGRLRFLRDYKEWLEILTLWEGNGTMFLRHKPNFGIWTHHGLGFTCLCYLQDSIFNTDSIRVS